MTAARTILIAVRDADLAAYAERRLRRRGHPVERAAGPEAARASVADCAGVVVDPAAAAAVFRAAPAPATVVLGPAPGDGAGPPAAEFLQPPFEAALLVEALEAAIRRNRHGGDAPPRPAPRGARTGADFFDALHGGAPDGRVLCLSGRAGSGTSVFALQFLARGIARGERCLLLSDRAPGEAVRYAQALRLPLAEAIESGRLIALELRHYGPAPRERGGVLPPESFEQLAEIVLSNRVRRVALDPGLPWLAGRDAADAVSFARAFDRTGATTLVTLPWPVSPAAHRLRDALEGAAGAAVRLALDADGTRRWTVAHYRGSPGDPGGIPFVVEPGIGLRRAARPAPPADAD